MLIFRYVYYTELEAFQSSGPAPRGTYICVHVLTRFDRNLGEDIDREMCINNGTVIKVRQGLLEMDKDPG